jgi:hypothetical protein
VSAVRRQLQAALAAVTLVAAAAACSDKTTSGEQSYQVDGSVTALSVGARAAAVTIEAGNGPVTVTEQYRYSAGKPQTAHQVGGTTLTLTESGCGDDDARCEVEYRIRVPAATSARITAHAGAVSVTGLAGDVHVTTDAGAVQGKALSGDEVVVVQTQAGATELEFAEAPRTVQAQTQVGAVAVRVPAGTAYAVEVGTDLGKSDISVDRDPASEHRIQVRTEVGAVTVEPLP